MLRWKLIVVLIFWTMAASALWLWLDVASHGGVPSSPGTEGAWMSGWRWGHDGGNNRWPKTEKKSWADLLNDGPQVNKEKRAQSDLRDRQWTKSWLWEVMRGALAPLWVSMVATGTPRCSQDICRSFFFMWHDSIKDKVRVVSKIYSQPSLPLDT